MKQFLKHFSFLATPPAFWTLTIGLGLLVLVSLPAAIYGFIENSSYYWWEWFGMAGQLLVTLATLTVLAALAIAGVLTLTGQWDTYLAWVMLKWDLFCDQRSSVRKRPVLGRPFAAEWVGMSGRCRRFGSLNAASALPTSSTKARL